MPIDDLLKQKVLPKPPDDVVRDYILAQLPAFVAPTDAAKWRREIPRLRRAALAKVYLKGYPPAIVNRRPKVVWGETLRPDPAYTIRKLRYEAYPDYWIPALLYQPAKLTGRVPVVLNPNGHHRGGKAVLYKQTRCANLARRGLLALSIEFIGMSELEADCNHNNIGFLNLTGLAGVGLFYLAMQKGLDVLLAHPHADSRRVAVTGLSGGGWQTIVFSALDPRVSAAVPVAGYTTIARRLEWSCDMGDLEQTPTDLTTVLDYDTMTAMLAPRPALLILNERDDCCFQTARTRPVIYDAVKPTYDAMGAADRFDTYNNRDPGTHNYDADNRSQFYKFINRHFRLATPDHDIHLDEELLTEDDLVVGLPEGQQTVCSLSLRRMTELARRRRTPRTAAERDRLRHRLAGILRLPAYEPEVHKLSESAEGRLLELRMGPWIIPATIVFNCAGPEVELVLNDAGRAAPMPIPLENQRQCLHADILGTGENKVCHLIGMALETTGARLLGIQVGQVLALARFALNETGATRVHLIGDGYQSCFAMLVAAALEPGLFASLTIYASIPTLRYIIEWPLRYEEIQPLLCFGLLEAADVPELRALLEKVEFRQPGRVTKPVTVVVPPRR